MSCGAMIQVANVSLTSVQILSLHSTPVTLIASPGSGLFINPMFIIIRGSTGTAYTASSGDSVVLNNRNTLFNLQNISGSADVIYPQTGTGLFFTGFLSASVFDNAPLTISMPTQNPTGGTLTIDFTIYYTVESTT